MVMVDIFISWIEMVRVTNNNIHYDIWMDRNNEYYNDE